MFLGGAMLLLILFLIPAFINFNDPESSVSLIMAVLLGISIIAPIFFYLSPVKLSTKSLYIFGTVILLLIVPQQLVLYLFVFGYCWSPGNCGDVSFVLFPILTLLTMLPPALLAIKFFRLARQQQGGPTDMSNSSFGSPE